MEPEGFIIVFTRARHWSLLWARLIQSIPPQPISLGSILILSPHLRLVVPGGFFPCGFPAKMLYAFLFSRARPMHATCPVHLVLDHPNYIWRKVQVLKLLTVQSSSASCHFIPLRSKYLLSILFSNIFTLLPSLNVGHQVSHPHRTTGKIIVLYLLISTFLDKKTGSELNGSKHYQSLICS
jgi:hypothetical protein